MREASMMTEFQNALIRLGFESVCVTKVVISPDWKYSSVYFIQNGVEEEDPRLIAVLKSKYNQICSLVKKRCCGHFFPKFRFIFDKEAVYRINLDQLLLNMDQEEKKNNIVQD